MFEFVGGSLALDMTNTVGGARGHESETEFLKNYSDLLRWALQAGLVTSDEAAELNAMSLDRGPEAEGVLERARNLREALYRIFLEVAFDRKAAEADIVLLNQELAVGLQRACIKSTAAGYLWGWNRAKELDAILAPVADAAARLLASPSLSRVRQCASDTCSWLFLDETKNHSRRWCNMKTCGNVHKVRRFRSRTTKRQAVRPSPGP